MDYDYSGLHEYDKTNLGLAVPEGENPLVIRFLVKIPGRTGLINGQTSVVLAKMAAAALRIDYKEFDILGVCMTEMPPTGQYGDVSIEPGTYTVDAVFKLRSWQTLWNSFDDMTSAAKAMLLQHGIDGALVFVAEKASFNLLAKTYESDSLEKFWLSRKPIFEWGGSDVGCIPTAYFKDWVHGNKPPADVDSQKSFSIGVADDIDGLEPMVGTKLQGSKQVNLEMPKPVLASRPLVLGASLEQLITLGIFAYIGYRIANKVELPKRLRSF